MAADAIEAIANAIAERDPAAETDASLALGVSGFSTLFGYLHRAGLGPAGAHLRAARCLDRAADIAASEDLGSSLFMGLPGVAWAMTHLHGMLYDDDAEDPVEEVDEAVLAFVDDAARDHDVVYGLSGLGAYALERLPRPAALELLERCVERLAAVSERRDASVRWRTLPEDLPPAQRDVFPDGTYDLGLAHGAPGVIAVLALARAAGIRNEGTGGILEHAVGWLLEQRLSDEPGSRIPALVLPGGKAILARTAWCYGDLGVAAALLVASRAAGEPAWERAALDIARIAARRESGDTGADDAGLCHGASGLGHMFNRLFQATGDEELREAAVRWLSRALDFRTDEGIGGFLSWKPSETGAPVRVSDASLLTGSTGIALVLLAAITGVEPEWDRAFLLSRRESAGA